MFTFFTRVPCPSRLATTETPARYFVTTSGNYTIQAAILNTVFPKESEWTLCQTFTQKVNQIEGALDSYIPLNAFYDYDEIKDKSRLP